MKVSVVMDGVTGGQEGDLIGSKKKSICSGDRKFISWMISYGSYRRAARRRQAWSNTIIVIQKWGTLAAYAMIAGDCCFY
jgi:hypothetical protein